jgi:glycosyltransferase involved in cell wall biosynthesis
VSGPLRILMVSGVPWRRDMGAARGQIELAEELRRLGHIVERFDYHDAFGDERPARWHRLFPLRFARRARRYVREHGRRFDVIEALHGDLPFTKRDLRFEGLLGARSMGLYALYEEYIRYERTTWPDRMPGTIIGKTLHRLTVRRRSAACRRSLATADLVRVLNEDEEAFVRGTLRFGHKCVTLSDGLTDGFAEALARAALPAGERLRRREVAFVGSWCLRKGAADWGEIVARTRTLASDASFRFLGTGRERADILNDLGLRDVEWISVVPHFNAHELPALLAGATVGSLPSYVEGCPFSILEQLAAGLPTIAYDVPGSRVMLGRLTRPLMVPRGDAARFAELLAELLTLDEGSYSRLAAECVSVASEFRCSEIAVASLEAYEAARRAGPGDGVGGRSNQRRLDDLDTVYQRVAE